MGHYLQIFTNRRVGIVLLLGFASGLPLPLVSGTLDAWMTQVGVSLATIGFFSLSQWPYNVKFLWAPLIDRYSPPFLGRRTSWMVLTQLLIAACIVGLAFSNPKEALVPVALFAVMLSYFSASQDIAIDAYRAEVLKPEELGAGAAVAVLGGRLALILGGGVALMMADQMPWRMVFLIMAGIMILMTVTTMFAPPASDRSEAPKSLKDAVVQPFASFFRKKDALWMLLFIFCFKFGDAMAGKMTTPFLMKIGFSLTDIGLVNKTGAMIVTIVGALVGAVVLSRVGVWRSLWIFGILQLLSNFVFVALAKAGASYPLMVACIVVENLCGGMGTAAFVAFLMSLCDRHYSATQYALLTSVMGWGRTLAWTFSGVAAEKLGWVTFFITTAALALPGLVLLTRFREALPNEAPVVSPADVD